jgi:hypothetical protein
MAGPDDDPSTTDEWWLLHDVLVFVMRYCKTREAAEDLIIEFWKKRHFQRSKYHLTAFKDYAISPNARIAMSSDMLGFQVLLDFDNSAIVKLYTQPDPLGPGRHILSVLEKYKSPNPETEQRLVRWHRDDVFNMLRMVGLLPSAPAPRAAEKASAFFTSLPSEATLASFIRGLPPNAVQKRRVAERLKLLVVNERASKKCTRMDLYLLLEASFKAELEELPQAKRSSMTKKIIPDPRVIDEVLGLLGL